MEISLLHPITVKADGKHCDDTQQKGWLEADRQQGVARGDEGGRAYRSQPVRNHPRKAQSRNHGREEVDDGRSDVDRIECSEHQPGLWIGQGQYDRLLS